MTEQKPTLVKEKIFIQNTNMSMGKKCFYSCLCFNGIQTHESLLYLPFSMRVSLLTGVAGCTLVEDKEMFRCAFFLPCRSECCRLTVCVIEVLVFNRVSWRVTVCVCVPQQLRMGLFLSGPNGNMELSESVFALCGPSVATAWETAKLYC